MRPMLKSLPLVVCVITLAGCSNPFGKEGYLRDKSGDYTKAKTAEPIQVPEDLNAKPLDTVLMIPPIAETNITVSEDYQVPRPDQRLTRKEGETYSIERDGDKSWLLAAKGPSEIWPRLEAFLEESKLDITMQDSRKGIIETNWADFSKDSEHGVVLRTIGKLVGVEDLDPMEDRFRIEVRGGVKPGTTEVHIQHKGRPPVESGNNPGPEPSDWNNLGPRSLRMDQAFASEMLVFLAKGDDNSSVSYLARDIDIGTNTELSRDGNGNPLLNIRGLPYSRSWAAIGDALDQAGITVADRNRSAGIYYLSTNAKTIAAPKKEQGFFSKLFSSKDKKAVPEETLHLRVSEFSDSVQVSVEKDSSTSADKEESLKLLELIKENLK